ncbi:DUF2584 family protein [Bacillaceae bacterium S4-13-58]
MSMTLTMNWKLMILGQEIRIQGEENLFQLTMSGYQLFPMDEPISIKRNDKEREIGIGVVKEVLWKDQKTILTYQLITLFTVN